MNFNSHMHWPYKVNINFVSFFKFSTIIVKALFLHFSWNVSVRSLKYRDSIHSNINFHVSHLLGLYKTNNLNQHSCHFASVSGRLANRLISAFTNRVANGPSILKWAINVEVIANSAQCHTVDVQMPVQKLHQTALSFKSFIYMDDLSNFRWMTLYKPLPTNRLVSMCCFAEHFVFYYSYYSTQQKQETADV